MLNKIRHDLSCMEEKHDHKCLWNKGNREQLWIIRWLKQSAHMLGSENSLSRPSVEINTIWDFLIKKYRRLIAQNSQRIKELFKKYLVQLCVQSLRWFEYQLISTHLDWIKILIENFERFIQYERHVKKREMHIRSNVVITTIKISTLVRKEYEGSELWPFS